MANTQDSGAKIYDRPERKTVSPLILVLALLAVLVAGYFAYRAWWPHAAGNPQNPPGVIVAGTAFLPGSMLNESLQ